MSWEKIIRTVDVQGFLDSPVERVLYDLTNGSQRESRKGITVGQGNCNGCTRCGLALVAVKRGDKTIHV